MDAFLELGKRSLSPSSDVLRGFFDATLDRGKPASALKGKCKTCQHRITLPNYVPGTCDVRTAAPCTYFVRTNVKSNVLPLLLVRV